MVKIYSAPGPFLVHHLKNILESHGILCEIRGEARAIAMGEIPVGECWPELWLLDNENAIRALKIIKDSLEAEEPQGEPWLCTNCNEENETQFTICWKCGQERIN
ncbi:MAG: DUF2007 domain-containing protein [Bacteroidia bacterium]|nr:DUF2007 domain-containing protein [Bacteroidia bacterium]